MADVRPFRALRYDASRVAPQAAIAPPYDVISPDQQDALYDRSPCNIVRVEYGRAMPGDAPGADRYARAAADLAAWQAQGALLRDDEPAIYRYELTFPWRGATYTRRHWFVALALTPWASGDVKPHEHTLSGPKADRLDLLRATRTQVSPVYCLARHRDGAPPVEAAGDALYDFEADGQRHVLTAVRDAHAIDAVRRYLARAGFYIADGHHRYETALGYRDERRAAAPAWTGDEPENFVLAAVTDAADPGLLVLPTHRVVYLPARPGALALLDEAFAVEDLGALTPEAAADALPALRRDEPSFVALGLPAGRISRLVLRDRVAAERRMPAAESEPWKRLDVNVLQFAVLRPVFGIDDAVLSAGGAVTYAQDPADAARAVIAGAASAAFLLRATPVDQIIAVSDVDGRMPQKSTYFYPKLPTGLVLRPLD